MAANKISISEVILNGIVFDPKNSEALKTMDGKDLSGEISDLFELLDQRRIDYLLVGGIAMLLYVQGRNTQDIDLIVDVEALDCLPEIEIDDRTPDFGRGHFGTLRVDLLFAHNAMFCQVRREFSARRQFVEREIPCATVEGLFLLKTFALPSLYRQGQFQRIELYEHDLAMLLREHKPDVPALLDLLTPHLSSSDMREIRTIVGELEQRIRQASKRFRSGEGN